MPAAFAGRHGRDAGLLLERFWPFSLLSPADRQPSRAGLAARRMAPLRHPVAALDACRPSIASKAAMASGSSSTSMWYFRWSARSSIIAAGSCRQDCRLAGEVSTWRRASIRSPTDETLPARADVVIIGGGIIGASDGAVPGAAAASRSCCAKRAHIAGEQSSRNWGWCRKMVRDPREMPLVIESLRLWERHERDGRGRDRLPHLRHHVSRPRPRRISRGSKAGSSTPANTSSTPVSSTAPRSRGCCRARRSHGPARSTPPATARASRRRRRRRSPPRRAGTARRSSPAAPCAASRPRPGGSPRSSPKRAASPASRWCWRAARGRGCSAAISASTCRS